MDKPSLQTKKIEKMKRKEAKESLKEKEKAVKVDHGSNLSARRARTKEKITVIMEKAKEKVNQKEKEKEKTIKEKEKVQRTRPMAVNHSLPPKQGNNNRKPLKVRINNSITTKIGLKTGPKIGGLKAMPPMINPGGAKIAAGGLHGLPSPIHIVFCPGWNPGTPLTCAKTLSTRFLI